MTQTQGCMKRTALVILITAIGGLSLGSVSTNVPLNHWSYAAIDKLAGQGLIDSAMLSTKPFSRLEMARLIYEAGQRAERQGERNRIILSLLDRLQKEFRFELDLVGSSRTGRSEDCIKPIEDPYVRWVYGSKPFDLENQSGDRFDKGGNLRLGFATRMNAFDRLAFYVHPEYRNPARVDARVQAVEAYGKTAIGRLDVEVGKDSLWWGPGYHGSGLMSNNAEPFTMLKVSNPEPIQLPWVFQRLGPFKAVYFLTKLEGNRDHPGVRLTGVRLSVKPHPSIELGGSRTIMFGGAGVPDIGIKDYLQIFWPNNIQANENQLASLDASWRIPMPGQVPARSARLYVDYPGEDAAGFGKYRPLFGLQLYDLFRTGSTDLRIEYANNHVGRFPNVFYNHGFYNSGYTYNGRVIGHYMGTDAEDLFVRLTHYLTPDLVAGIDFNRLQTNLSGSPKPVTNRYGADLFWFAPHNWEIRTTYRYEQVSDGPASGNNHILDLSLVYNF